MSGARFANLGRCVSPKVFECLTQVQVLKPYHYPSLCRQEYIAVSEFPPCSSLAQRSRRL